uniref:Uncharacterized protein n=1 Tax=Arundo donax TaxID=35708 RepID=A0A0A9G088_ARUDO
MILRPEDRAISPPYHSSNSTAKGLKDRRQCLAVLSGFVSVKVVFIKYVSS